MSAIPALGVHEVRVWHLHADALSVEAGVALLSTDERARMERMRLGIARHEFVVGRAVLRVLAGKAVGCSPRDVSFATGQHGKPRVEGVEFSVAHSHGKILIALCQGAAVGVDVEWLDRSIEAVEIARQSFAPAEVRRIEEANEGPERTRVFYDVWTKKEALVKAHGQGLTMALQSFEAPDGAAEQQVRLVEDSYFLRGLDVEDGFVGALATSVAGMAVRMHDLDSSTVIGWMREHRG